MKRLSTLWSHCGPHGTAAITGLFLGAINRLSQWSLGGITESAQSSAGIRCSSVLASSCSLSATCGRILQYTMNVIADSFDLFGR
jgi:hypothetical protein